MRETDVEPGDREQVHYGVDDGAGSAHKGVRFCAHPDCGDQWDDDFTSDDPEFRATWVGGHALIIEFGDEELRARCQCGAPLGVVQPASAPLDKFGLPWERHVMSAEEA
jgi:hypothetical protein